MSRDMYLCARSSMPAPPMSILQPTRASPGRGAKDTLETMTLQHKASPEHSAANGRKKVKWAPFADESAIDKPVHNSWLEKVQGSSHQTRDRATTSRSPIHAKPSVPSQLSLLNLPSHTNSATYLNPPNKNKSRRRKKPAKQSKMSTPAPTAGAVSIPPHLRRRNAELAAQKAAEAAGATANAAAVSAEKKGDATVDSVDAKASAEASESNNSKAAQNTPLHSSSLATKQPSKSPPSPPTTAQGSDKVETAKWTTSIKPRQPVKAIEDTCPTFVPPVQTVKHSWAACSTVNATKKAEDSWAPYSTANVLRRAEESRAACAKANVTKKVEFGGWDEPDSPPNAPRRIGTIPWARVPKQPYKQYQWPKARDMKHASPGSDSDGGVVVDTGFKSDSNGDADYDVKKLLDWKGDWLPAPETWAYRKGYSDRHFTEHIDKWININPDFYRPMPIQEPAFSGRKTVGGAEAEYIVGKTEAGANEYNELVPRKWINTRVEHKTLREYWTDMPKKAPEALPDCDITATPPWWERYTDPSSCFITSLAMPEAKMNMFDEENPIIETKLACVEDKLTAIFARRKARYNRTMVKRSRPVPESEDLGPPVVSRGIDPMMNVYFRPVQPADVRGIAEIYNYYVERTIFANEFDGRREDQIRRRVDDVTRAGLPFLVAIVKGQQAHDPAGHVSEKIVGFISLDDFVDQSSMFRFTFDMELYVHPGFVQKRIAKCLLDKLLEITDTTYKPREGYDYRNDSEYLKTGHGRVIKTILLNVHHESGEDFEWQTKFLNDFGFVRCGRMPGIGYKLGQVVDVSIFSYHTSEVINASGKPSVRLERI
ncbi:hypothetical protein IAQ61_005326, partial [Plenodomus lingam]|uniref:N-acetyltransferase domain-containing protein n=1 Tax=Leptosphaeria maculans (strain JN3 / isolate v23.1.3 / race Av1-4-5-6-7-8) TaxID=985895 RepID=E4ZS25_LEPMJ